MLSLADGSQISNCSLPCTTHQIYAWLTHKSKRRGAGKTASKGDGDKVNEGLIGGDGIGGVEETKGYSKKDKKEGSKSKDDIWMEETRLIDGNHLDNVEQANASRAINQLHPHHASFMHLHRRRIQREGKRSS